MQATDSTPGIWQTEWTIIVLAHVAHAIWREDEYLAEASSGAYGDRARAHAVDELSKLSSIPRTLSVVFSSGAPSIDLGEQNGIDFLRALNLYWESRSRDAQLR